MALPLLRTVTWLPNFLGCYIFSYPCCSVNTTTTITTTTTTTTSTSITTATATTATTTTATANATAITATTTTKWKRKNSGKSDEEPLGKTYSFHYSDWYIFIFISKCEEQNVITLLVEIRKRRRCMKKENERMYLARYNVSVFLFCFVFCFTVQFLWS